MIKYRKATKEDSLILWQWRNDELTRVSSLNPEFISLDKHSQWFEASLHSQSRIIYIAELEDKPIGTLRTDLVHESLYELSWTVAPEFRSRGLGKKMLSGFVNTISYDFCARIKQNNKSSIRISEHAGFVSVRCEGDVLYMERLRKPCEQTLR
jgi:L-amino acid N-acyltransferase YncA